ncbi:hypothetical protein DL93DRAFT_2087152 [Clavulina sp. PMI_390]|nr:hypothetical protein DL93DRAFT_2087152 [Clavulina sp. PMI_390]
MSLRPFTSNTHSPLPPPSRVASAPPILLTTIDNSARLPNEIISEVFLCCLETFQEKDQRSRRLRALAAICAVCRRWRKIAISTLRLWSSIVFHLKDPRKGSLERVTERAKVHLARAGKRVPLDISFDCSGWNNGIVNMFDIDYDDPHRPPPDDPTQIFHELISPYYTRSRTLHLVLSWDDAKVILPVQGPLPKLLSFHCSVDNGMRTPVALWGDSGMSLSALEHLDLMTSGPLILNLQDCPSLRSLRLSGEVIISGLDGAKTSSLTPPIIPPAQELSSLRSLHLTEGLPWEGVLSLLGRATNVTEAQICLSEPYPSNSNLEFSAEMPLLRNLITRHVEFVSEHMQAPQVTHIVIDDIPKQWEWVDCEFSGFRALRGLKFKDSSYEREMGHYAAIGNIPYFSISQLSFFGVLELLRRLQRPPTRRMAWNDTPKYDGEKFLRNPDLFSLRLLVIECSMLLSPTERAHWARECKAIAEWMPKLRIRIAGKTYDGPEVDVDEIERLESEAQAAGWRDMEDVIPSLSHL